jgi:hypothetical protein
MPASDILSAAEGLGLPGLGLRRDRRTTEWDFFRLRPVPPSIWRLELTVSTVEAAVAAKELRRWVAWLGGSMLVACVFFAAALAGLGAWLIAPAIIIGPGVGGVSLIWLALSTDTNGVAALAAAEPVAEEPAVAA